MMSKFTLQIFDYQPGDEILILTNNPTTLQDHGIGPFSITQVYTNGTITFYCTPHMWKASLLAESTI